MDGGQFDLTDLTFKDLDTIANSFTKVFSGFFHAREKYPEIVKINDVLEAGNDFEYDNNSDNNSDNNMDNSSVDINNNSNVQYDDGKNLVEQKSLSKQGRKIVENKYKITKEYISFLWIIEKQWFVNGLLHNMYNARINPHVRG